MKAQLKMIDGVNVFFISGKLTLDGSENLQEIIYKDYLTADNLFCLDGLRFVGSTGVTVLLQTFQKINSVTGKALKFSNVNPEYHKIFMANLVGIYEAYETVDHGIFSYRTPVHQPQVHSPQNMYAETNLTQRVQTPGGATVSESFPATSVSPSMPGQNSSDVSTENTPQILPDRVDFTDN